MFKRNAKRLFSIRYKFAGIQFVSILFTVVLVSVISLSLFSEYYSLSSREKLQVHVDSLAFEAQHQLTDLVSKLEGFVPVNCRSGQRERLLAELRPLQSFFPRVFFYDLQGRPLVSLLVAEGSSETQLPLAQEVLSAALAQPQQVQVTLAESFRNLAGPVLLLTQAKVSDTADRLQGVLQVALPVKRFAKAFFSHSIQNDVELVLVDAAGRLLLHSVPENLPAAIHTETLPWLASLDLSHEKVTVLGKRRFHEVESYYCYKPLVGVDWAALAIMPASRFNLLLQQLIRGNVYLSLFGLMVGLLLAHLMVRPILANIARIKQQTQNLAAGKLDERIEIESRDELSDLAVAVNRLTEKLLHASAAYDSVDLMLQTLTDPVVICDGYGAIFRTNAAAQELFRVTAEDFAGQSLSRYFAQRSPLAVRELLQEMLQQPRLKNFESEIQVAGGETLPVHFSFAHAYEEDGEDRFIVCLFKDISQQKVAESEITQLAYYDSLTGLPNRSLLHDRLEMAIRQTERSTGEHRHFAVMFLDLDHFKVVNDTLGHSIGDRLLQGAAERLRSILRNADTVSRPADELSEGERVLARLGGDEFIILLPQLRSGRDAGLVARQIIDEMAKPFLLEGHEVVTPASVGVAIYPDDGTDSETLLRCADVAMYHAKSQGRNSFFFFSEEMNAAARERLSLEHFLRRDIESQRGIYLVYQPKVDLASSRVVGMEVMTRWRNEELGEVSPERFIPIAEESGLIVPLGEWILKTACQQLCQWQERYGWRYRLAVNLSGRQLKHPQFLSMVASVLHETGVEPGLLELELTESMLMETVEKTIQLLGQLKQLGVTLAIDDFGTGYSSLNYLKRFPIDTLKIDQSFVRDLESDKDDAAIIEAIIAMAHTLRMEVVAEGVETELQLEFLRQHGADLYQGFLFAKPVPAAVFEERFIR